jgi:hypothetical protein
MAASDYRDRLQAWAVTETPDEAPAVTRLWPTE